MYKIQVTIASGARVTIYFNSSLAVHESKEGPYIYIVDGLHNNGGWKIPTSYHSYDEIIQMIDTAITGA